MDTTLGKPEDFACRCCMNRFDDMQLQSLFEYTTDEMELYKIVMLIAPIAICRNDGKMENLKIYFDALKSFFIKL